MIFSPNSCNVIYHWAGSWNSILFKTEDFYVRYQIMISCKCWFSTISTQLHSILWIIEIFCWIIMLKFHHKITVSYNEVNNWCFNFMLISSPEHRVLSELLWSLTFRCCPSDVRSSVHNLLVNTLASTNINQSSLNFVKMYMTTRARMSSIMELIGPELSELSALELENLPYLTMFTL